MTSTAQVALEALEAEEARLIARLDEINDALIDAVPGLPDYYELYAESYAVRARLDKVKAALHKVYGP